MLFCHGKRSSPIAAPFNRDGGGDDDDAAASQVVITPRGGDIIVAAVMTIAMMAFIVGRRREVAVMVQEVSALGCGRMEVAQQLNANNNNKWEDLN